MRSIAVILLAAVAFGAFLYVNHRRAADLLARDLVALERLRAYAKDPGAPPLEEGGYRFRWITTGPFAPLAVAGPTRPHESGVRWFASLGEVADPLVYEFDTVLNRSPDGVPPFGALRAYLALPVEERTTERRPFGWRRVLQP